MKKLLKNKIYGSVNSAWIYCSQLTWSNSAAEKKKKKKRKKKERKKKSENTNATTDNSNPNSYRRTTLIRFAYLGPFIRHGNSSVVNNVF